MTATSDSSVLKVLSDDAYVRERQEPSPFGTDYLLNADLVALIQQVAPEVRGTVFDYGSGGAPYAYFFDQCAGFVAADILAGPKVNRILQADGMTNEANESYDFVLSTQVLEHVPDPRAYLRECLRILRPGGRILLTTHGMFQEHGCPHDYWRWTARGLQGLFTESGFEILRSGKTTTQIRGITFMMNHFTHHLRYKKRPVLHIPMAILRKIYQNAAMPLFNKFADLFKDQKIVDAESPDCIYIGVFTHAQKPA